MNDEASIRIVGTVQRVFTGAKVTKVNVRCNVERTTYVDVTSFSIIKVSKGDKVRISGHLSAEKAGTQEVSKSNGKTYDKWIPMLVADSVEVIGPAQPLLPGAQGGYSPPDGDDIPF